MTVFHFRCGNRRNLSLCSRKCPSSLLGCSRPFIIWPNLSLQLPVVLTSCLLPFTLILPDSVQMSLPLRSFPSPLPRHSVQGRITCSDPGFPQVPYNFYHHLVMWSFTLWLLPLRECEFSDCGNLDLFLLTLASSPGWTHNRCSINGYLKTFC